MSVEKINTAIKEWMPVLFAVLTACWLGFFFLQPFSGKTSDFPQYHTPPRLIFTGHGADAYKFPVVLSTQHADFPGMGERVVATYLPPPSLFWFLPFGMLPGLQAFAVWKVVQAVALILSVILLRDIFKLNRKALCWLIAGLCASGPAFAATQLGQTSMLVLLALTTLVWSFKNERIWLAAVALAILLIKPQEGLPIIVFLAGAKRYKMLAMTAAVMTAAFLVVFALTGPQAMSDWVFWTQSAVDKSQSALMQSELGPTVRGQLLRILPDSKTLVTILSSAVALIAYVFIFIAGRKFAASKGWQGAELLIAVPIGVVTCFHLHSYDLVLLAPSLVQVLSGPIEAAAPPWLLLIGFLLVGTFMVPFYMYIHWDYLLNGHGLLNPHFFAILALSFGLSYLAFKYRYQLEFKS